MSHSTEIDSKDAWGGGQSPLKVSYGKMMMWFFLVSDALTFGGLLTSYGFIRHKYADVWPKAENVFTHFPFVEQHLPLAYVGLMTFILIMSSVTMVLAVEAGHRNDKRKVIVWMFWTIVGGATFGSYNEDGQTVFTFSVAIDSKYQGRGFGKKLVQDVMGLASGEGYFNVWVVNPNMAKLLESMGFETESSRGWSQNSPHMTYYS